MSPLLKLGKTGRIFIAHYRTRGHDIAWAAIIAALIGAGASKSQADEAKKGLANASAEQKNALMTALAGTEEYQSVGKAGANSLGELMGLEGFRTKADIALRQHLAAKPKDLPAGGPANERDYRTTLDKQEEYSTLGDVIGGVTKHYKGRTKKRQEKAAAANAIAAAKLAQETAVWEAKKAELEKQRDLELQTYDPTASLRATPGYSNRYNTGLATATGALNRNNMSQSGRALKELTNYGQDFASNEYGSEFSRRLALMTGGQSLAGQTGGWGLGTGNSLAAIAAGQGQAQADYYGNLNNVAQGSLANYTYNQNRQADRDSYGRRGSSYGTNDNYVMADKPAYQQKNWWETE